MSYRNDYEAAKGWVEHYRDGAIQFSDTEPQKAAIFAQVAQAYATLAQAAAAMVAAGEDDED